MQMSDLETLFSPCPIGARMAPNRLVAQPVESNDGTERGEPTERTVLHYANLARGGWGTVVVESTSVNSRSLGRLHGLVLTEETASSYEKMVAAFKDAYPDALFIMQITHSGRQSHPSTDLVTITPNSPGHERYLSADEIQEIVDESVVSARLAEELGFDGVDYKMCNAYLGTETMRPTNTRPDRWGGCFENRMRFMTEGVSRILAARQSADFVVGARISFCEGSVGGFGSAGPDTDRFDPTEPLESIRVMDRLGMDFCSITGLPVDLTGHDLTPAEVREPSLYYERLTKELIADEDLSLPVLGAGYSELGQDTWAIAAQRIRDGHADCVGFARQTLSDPFAPAKLRRGESISYCTRCNICQQLVLNQFQGGCVVYDDYFAAQLPALRELQTNAGDNH